LINWVVTYRMSDGSDPPPRREDWNRHGSVSDGRPGSRGAMDTRPRDLALAAYEADRLPNTAELVRNNRRAGPEGVIDEVERRAPDGFDDINDVLGHAEREAIVKGYAQLAGFAKGQVNRTGTPRA
jgi:hypothetical protein